MTCFNKAEDKDMMRMMRMIQVNQGKTKNGKGGCQGLGEEENGKLLLLNRYIVTMRQGQEALEICHEVVPMQWYTFSRCQEHKFILHILTLFLRIGRCTGGTTRLNQL